MDGRIAYTLAAIVALGLAACGGGGGGGTPAPSAQTVNVQIDAKTSAFTFGSTAYYPSDVSAHPGDTVMFTSVFTGEPHTVTFGTLVDKGLAAYDTQAASNPNVDDHSIPDLAAIPDLIPQGPGDANQVTGQPCFLDSGNPPGTPTTPCPKRSQPDFTGTQSLYNSGFLPDKATFSMKLSNSIQPGTYRFMCALHRTNMTGKITVVAASQSVPSADQVKAAGDQQLQKFVQALQPVITQANQGNAQKVSAGVGSRDARAALGLVFAPKEVSIPVGGAVTWIVFGAHTISFNAPEGLKVAISKAPDGSVHLNPMSLGPAGGPPGPQQPNAPPSSQNPPPIIGDGGSWNGAGFRNTGIMLSFPPQLLGFKLTFTTAGTYTYKCLIHPDMEGKVTVG
jgi:plastocyanin